MRRTGFQIIFRSFPRLALAGGAFRAAECMAAETGAPFPIPLHAYQDQSLPTVGAILLHRIQVEPLNLVATIIFALAVLHTFFAARIMKVAKRWAEADLERFEHLRAAERHPGVGAEMLHFFGEVEAIFAIWAIPLLIAIAAVRGWDTAKDYLDHTLAFREPIFVVVIMTIAATRPVITVAESLLRFAARLAGGGVAAWWFSILMLAPVLGSLITEPAAMTIAAVLLGQQFYARRPAPKFAYATLGLLFVNVSVGGVLTNFAAPPVLMVASSWKWDTPFMLEHFGWKAIVGILVSNLIYFAAFRGEFVKLGAEPPGASATRKIPWPVTAVHLLFMAWTVLNAHHPVLVIGGFLVFLAFAEATQPYQGRILLRPPLLVGLFLAGLVIHGFLQAWWLGPVLARLGPPQLLVGAAVLTAFNDNAAITYLASQVPSLAAGLQYAVVAGAVAGGGLTIIANAPNPAGYSLLRTYFPNGLSPLWLVLSALLPTIIMVLIFALGI